MIHDNKEDNILDLIFTDAISLSESKITEEIRNQVDIEKFNDSKSDYLNLLLIQDFPRNDLRTKVF